MFDANSLVGRQIHQFRVERFIARGAMGMVFKAHDAILSRTVALKVIPKTVEDDMSDAEVFSREEARKRLIQEAKAAGRLAHPNIVTIHSYGETDDLQYICMEYVSGETLAQILKKRKFLTESEAIPIFEQILLALEAAGREDIIHRDIKPANIMITDDNRVKVMDFGIARLPTISMTVTGMVLGTPFYMSPEQISGKRIDIRSDIFSVGAVFYQVLTGERPFDGDTTATITYKITLVEPVPPNVLNANVSLPMAGIILRALSKDAAQRYRSPGEMLEDVRNLHRTQAADEHAPTGAASDPHVFQKTVLAEKPGEPAAQTTSPPADDSPRAARSSAASGGTGTKPAAGKEPETGKGEGERESDEAAAKPPPRMPSDMAKGLKSRALLPTILWAVFVVLALWAVERVVSYWSPFGGSPKSTEQSDTGSAPGPGSLTASPGTTISPPPPAAPSPAQVPETAVSPQPSPPPESQARTAVNSLVLEAGRQFVTNPLEARRLLEQALSIEPDNFDTTVMLARLLAFRKDYPGAISAYRKALNLNGKAYELHYELGCIYLSQGNYDAAIPSFESSLALGPPGRDDLLANLAFCYKQKNNPAKARDLYKQALEINPENQSAKAFLQSAVQSTPPTPAAPVKVAPTGKADTLKGTYRVEGKNPNGRSYYGTAFVQGSGSQYTVTWKIAGQSYSGIGDLSGRKFTVNWKDATGTEGVVYYTVLDSGAMKGVWANGKATETLTPLK